MIVAEISPISKYLANPNEIINFFSASNYQKTCFA